MTTKPNRIYLTIDTIAGFSNGAILLGLGWLLLRNLSWDFFYDFQSSWMVSLFLLIIAIGSGFLIFFGAASLIWLTMGIRSFGFDKQKVWRRSLFGSINARTWDQIEKISISKEIESGEGSSAVTLYALAGTYKVHFWLHGEAGTQASLRITEDKINVPLERLLDTLKSDAQISLKMTSMAREYVPSEQDTFRHYKRLASRTFRILPILLLGTVGFMIWYVR